MKRPDAPYLISPDRTQADSPPMAQATFTEQFVAYAADAIQRNVLFMDLLRTRVSNMLEHERNGLPPLLEFGYEMVVDTRAFAQSVNYALVKILSARSPARGLP